MTSDSYYKAGDNGYPYSGENDFNTTGITPDEATLTVVYPASCKGNYTFNGNALPWSNPHQGPYFGYQSWNVTNYFTGGDSFMTFDRNGTHSGAYSGYFKIQIALLTLEEEEE
jgi:hypothetical protein